MKQSKIITNVLNILSIILYFLAGIAVIIFSRDESNFDHTLLGWVLIATSICRIINAVIERDVVLERPYELILPLINFGFGFVVLLSNMSMVDICLFWGLLEICASSIEMTMAFRIIKKELINILNVLINVVEFIFGILLCVHLEEGITVHLVITGSLFIAIGIEEILLMVLEHRAERKQNGK